MRTYSELITIPTFEERLEYLRVNALPGEVTFGVLRKINQKFYSSRLWKRVRAQVIARDLGYDLGVPGYDIYGRVLVHHINPLSPQDVLSNTELTTDLDNLITVSNETHLGIHYGYRPQVPRTVERFRGDTKLW